MTKVTEKQLARKIITGEWELEGRTRQFVEVFVTSTRKIFQAQVVA